MSKIHERIMRMNTGKHLKQIIIAVLCVLLIGGGLSAVMLRTQIGEVVTTVQKWDDEEGDKSEKHKDTREEQDGEKFNSQFENDYEGEFDDIDYFDHITEPSPAAKVVVGLTGLLGTLLTIAYWILVAAWLYQRAIQADMNGLLWFLLGIGGNLGAGVVFLVIRGIFRENCPSCGKWQKESIFCRRCGAAVSQVCSDCGQTCRNTDKFCGSCGRKLKDEK